MTEKPDRGCNKNKNCRTTQVEQSFKASFLSSDSLLLVLNISPFRYSTLNAPCQITQVAEALRPEEGEQDFCLAWSTLLHQECKTCWLEGDNCKDNASQSQENLHGSSWPVTSSAQMQSHSASVTLKYLLTEAHLLCAISNTPRKWPVLCPEHSASERLEL